MKALMAHLPQEETSDAHFLTGLLKPASQGTSHRGKCPSVFIDIGRNILAGEGAEDFY